MAELVDARDSKSRAARRAGSIPALGTKKIKKAFVRKPFLFPFSGFFYWWADYLNRLNEPVTTPHISKFISAVTSMGIYAPVEFAGSSFI